MKRSTLTSVCLALAVAVFPVVSFAQVPAPATVAAPSALSPVDAKPFLGDWTVAGESQMGPMAFAMSLKVDDGKVVGNLSSDVQAPTVITDITKAGENVILRYAFDYQGNMVPVVVTLTPKAEKLDVYFSFADGAFEVAAVGSKTAAQ